MYIINIDCVFINFVARQIHGASNLKLNKGVM